MADQPGTLGEYLAQHHIGLHLDIDAYPSDGPVLKSVLGLPLLYGPERVCRKCDGRGTLPSRKFPKCPKCDGTGTIPGQPVGIVSQEALEAAGQAIDDAINADRLNYGTDFVRVVCTALGIEVADERHEGIVRKRTHKHKRSYIEGLPVAKMVDGDRVTVLVINHTERERKEGE